MQSSLKSEMRNMSFAHVTNFTHRHFSEARHDFQARQKDEFLRSIAADMAHEAAQATFARAYIKYHKHPYWDSTPECEGPPHRDSRRRLRRKKEQQKTVPKHFYVDDWHRSDFDRGVSAA